MGGFNFPKKLQRVVEHDISIKKVDLQKATDSVYLTGEESRFSIGEYTIAVSKHPDWWVKANRCFVYYKGDIIAYFFTKQRKINRNKFGLPNSCCWIEIV